jgi:hypothetical protein
LSSFFASQADAVSGNTQMNAALWDEFHQFRLEWELPEADIGGGASEGYVRWYMDDTLVYGISGESLSNKMKGSQVKFLCDEPNSTFLIEARRKASS